MRYLGFWLLWASTAFGVDCKSVISTAFGPTDVITAAYHRTAGLTWIYDGSISKEGKPTLAIAENNETLPVWNHGGVQSFGVQPDRKHGSYLYVLDGSGVLHFITPDRLIFGVNVPTHATIRAAALYQAPFREIEREILPTRGLKSADETPESVQSRRQKSDLLEGIAVPTFLYAAAENSVYRASVTPVQVDSESAIGKALMNGAIRLTDVETPLGKHLEVESLEANVIDWDVPGKTSHVYIPTGRGEAAYEATPFERLLTITDTNVMNSIDFLQALGPTRMLVGSELGQVIVVDGKTKEIVHSLRMEGASWTTGLAGYQLPNETVVWAINRRQLVRWSSKDMSNILRPTVEQLPDGEIPFRVTVAGQAATMGSSANETGGYFTNFRSIGDEMVMERALVLSESGKLYGLREKTSFLSLYNEYEWVLLPSL